MYAVVGCSECQALWIVEGNPERSQCPRCGTSRKYEKRKQFVTTEDENHAREVRASMLASRGGYDEEFAKLDSFAELESAVEQAGVDDETYLEQSGVDPEEVATAGERQDTSGRSRKETVLEALAELDDPTREDILEYASQRDVPAEYTERALDKLVRAGEVSESRGVYRLL